MDNASNNDLSLQDFTTVIAGSWINPKTNNKYIFTTDPKDSLKGEVSIKQNGTETLIPLRIEMAKDSKGIQVLVENAAYTVSLIEEPEKTLTIDLPPVGSMRLIKIA